MTSLDSFADIFTGLADLFGSGRRGGGRRPEHAHQIATKTSSDSDTSSGDELDDKPPPLTKTRKVPRLKSWQRPCDNGAARLTIVQITDVYTLDNFASLKTMLKEIRQQQHSTETTNPVLSMLTGDFLAPYLLSSVDRGQGMMNAIQKTPIDILTWGNHEADIPHPTVCRHVRKYKGTWINSNMQNHDEMKHQVPYHVVTVQSADGRQTRKIGFVAVLSNDPKLYSQFQGQGAFGGATITDPWDCLEHYRNILTQPPHSCDLVVPLEHLYLHENQVTCQRFGGNVFPLILSGHDHHRVDQIINGTRIVKAGMDGVAASVVEITWPSPEASAPKISNKFVETETYTPCPKLKRETDAAYDVLLPLRNTELVGVLPQFRPLSSQNARGQVTTMGRLICSLIKSAINQTLGSNNQPLDAVILMGGNIRGNQDYPDDAFFSMETLEAELKADEVLGVVDIPGSVLAAGIEFTHAGDPRPGWFQYDDGISQDAATNKITHVMGQPLDPQRKYRCATKIKDLTNGQSEPLKEYFTQHPQELPSKGSYYNMHTELMSFFARSLFRKLWDVTSVLMEQDPEEVLDEYSIPAPTIEHVEGQLRHAILDREGDGIITVDDIHWAMKEYLGLSVSNDIKTLAQAIHDCADITGNGRVTVDDFEQFCTKMPREYRLPRKWNEAFPDPDVAELQESKSHQDLVSLPHH